MYQKLMKIWNNPENIYYRAIFYYVQFFIFFALTIFIFINGKIVPWPFHRITNIDSAIRSICIYSVVLVAPVFSLILLRYANISVKESFKWNKFSYSFFIGFFGSIAYSAYLFALPRLKIDISFLPVVIILSIFNAVSEELFFRETFYTLLKKATGSLLVSNIIQSMFYSFLHFAVWNYRFGLYSLGYGLILGYIREKTDSIVPCLICHFCIDIGCIGTPMLGSFIR